MAEQSPATAVARVRYATLPIPLNSGRTWEQDPAGNQLAGAGRTTATWLRDLSEPSQRALFKQPPPGNPTEIYSVGMERVACVLGQLIGVPIPDTHLETFAGAHGSIQLRVPDVRTWQNVPATPMLMLDVVNRADWPVCVCFDIWMANTDRVARNILQQVLPAGTRPAVATKSRTWLIDNGLCGLWFPSKFAAPNVSNVTIGDGTMKPGVESDARSIMPADYRRSFTNLNEDERRIVIDRVKAVTDDEVRKAVEEVPAQYGGVPSSG